MSALFRLIFGLLEENPKGKSRGLAVTRGTLLAVCGTILLCVKDIPDQMRDTQKQLAILDKRMALIELRVGAVTPQADNDRDAMFVTGPGPVTGAASRDPGTSNQFAFTHK